MWSQIEKQPHLQDTSMTKTQDKPHSVCEVPTKLHCISLCQQTLMSLLRARPGELAVRGNYLCLPQQRTMLHGFCFFFTLKNTVSADFVENTAVYFAREIRVFSFTELARWTAFWKWSAWNQRFWLQSAGFSLTRVDTCIHRGEQAKDLNIRTHATWETGRAL